MESNAAVTLQFEDPGIKIICFENMCEFVNEQMNKLFNQVLLINVKFLFLNILKTKCNSVQERAFLPFLTLSLQIFTKKKFTLIKST